MVDGSDGLPTNQLTFTRQQLYQLIWKHTMRDVAAAIGISDVAVAKACRRLNIPVPGRGYWAKIAAGHVLSRSPLLEDPHGRTEVRFEARRAVPAPSRIEELAHVSGTTNPEAATPSVALQDAVELSDLSKPHPLTRTVRAGLRRGDLDSRGLHCTLPASGWKVAVSQATTERALVVFDTICLSLRKMGAIVKDGPKEHWQSEPPKCISLDDEPIHVAIREHVRQRRRAAKELAELKKAGEWYPRAHEYLPSGNLVVSIPNAPYNALREWRDTKSSVLEDQLPQILSALAALPTVFKNARREQEEVEKAYREAESKRWKVEQRKLRNKERVAELLTESRALADQNALVGYLDHLERQVVERNYVTTDTLTKGIAKARALAAKLDPTEQRIALLQNFGLVTLSESRYYRAEDEEDA